MSSSEQMLRYPRPWQQTLYGYLALARISNSPTVVSNVLAGAALAGALRPNGRVALLALALVLFYTAGMYLNDLCDYAIDCRQRPERPLPSGIISRISAGLVAAGLFAAAGLILWYVGWRSFVAGFVLTALIIAYDAWHKTNPLSPLIMAGCRVSVYVIAFLAFQSRVSGTLVFAGGLLLLYVVGLTYIAKTESRPDLARYWPAVFLFLPAANVALQPPSTTSVLVLLLFVIWTAYSISFVYRSHVRNIGGAIARLIAGMSLVDALVLAATGATVNMLIALLAVALTLSLQRYIRGT